MSQTIPQPNNRIVLRQSGRPAAARQSHITYKHLLLLLFELRRERRNNIPLCENIAHVDVQIFCLPQASGRFEFLEMTI